MSLSILTNISAMDTNRNLVNSSNAVATAMQRLSSGLRINTAADDAAGYAISQRKRKRIEESFGWLKTIALMRKVRHRGIFKVGWVFTFAAAAYNLVRMRNLLVSSVGAA